MPAKTNLTLDTTWGGSLSIRNHELTDTTRSTPPTASVGIGTLGGTATLQYSTTCTLVEYPDGPTNPCKVNVYYVYELRANVTGSLVPVTEKYICSAGFYWAPPGPLSVPPPAGTSVGANFDVAVSMAVTGIRAYTQVINATYDDRESPKDYTDRTFSPSWYIDGDTTVTVNAGNLTKTGDLTFEAGPVDVEPHDVGSNFAARWTFTLNSAPAVNTVYAAISSPTAGGTGAVNLTDLNLHNPGTGDTPEEAITAGWYYEPPTSGGYWHIFDDGGIAIERKVTASTGSGISWAGATGLPYLVTMVFNDGAFTDESGNSLTIEYDCGAVEWDAESESYLPHYFTGDETWDEFHSDWDGLGWRRWEDNHEVYAETTSAWRLDNGEV